MDKGQCTEVIFVDLRIAFVNVDYKMLLKTREKCGIDNAIDLELKLEEYFEDLNM